MKMLRRTTHLALVVLVFAVMESPALAQEDDEIPFEVARLFFQLNDTDGDLGIHMMVDGDPWKSLEVDNPRDRRILGIRTQSKLRRQGLTELKFESAEPTFDELDPAKFFRRFPEGEYDIEGMGLEGEEYESTVYITHVLPAAPDNLRVNSMETPDDCEENSGPTVGSPYVLSWDEVTQSHESLGKPGPVDIVRYEVAVERDEPTVLVLQADIHGPATTQFDIPEALLSSGDEIKFQILVQDEAGNETSAESCFEVE